MNDSYKEVVKRAFALHGSAAEFEAAPGRRSALAVAFALLMGGECAFAATLEEVIVTAQKREESLMDVPISVAAIAGETLESFKIDKFQELEFPGVQVGQGGRTDSVFIRGIGSGENAGFEQSAPFFMDGLYYGRARTQRMGFLDMDRLEVLRGPQPIYLGKNAIAGAFNISSRRPRNEFGGELEMSHEFEAEETVVGGAVTGPLSENLSARVALKYRNMEGFVRNLATGDDEPSEEDLLGRVSFSWIPSESVDVFFKVEAARDDVDGRSANFYNCQPAAFGGEVDPALEDCVFDDRRAASFDPALNAPASGIFAGIGPEDNFVDRFDYVGSALVINWNVNGYLITSTTGYYDFDNSVFSKADFSTIERASVDLSETSDQISQELRVLSPRGEKFEWVAGAYVDSQEISSSNYAAVPALGIGLDNRMNSEQADSWAVFAEVGFDVTDAIKVRAGGRYTEVEKEADYERFLWAIVGDDFSPPIVYFPIKDSRKDSDFQPAVTIEWRPNDNAMFYVSRKEGFKAGGFDHSATTPDLERFNFDPEKAVSWELGGKLSMLDGGATLSAALFRMDFEDLQVTQLLPSEPGFSTDNAAEARSQGLELEAAWAASDYLTLSATLSFLEARYEEFEGAECFGNPAQTPEEGCVTDPVTGGRSQDLSGEPLRFGPEYSGIISAAYDHPLSGRLFGNSLSWFARADLFFTDSFYTRTTPDPDERQDAYEKLDARIGIGSDTGGWELALVGRNLTDEQTWHWAQSTPVSGAPGPDPLTNTAVLDRPRSIELSLRLRY
jgi:outer membrane receptor protein involved in Fe transport